jgi:hypothetical protein
MNVDSIVQLPFDIAQSDFNETPNVPPEHVHWIHALCSTDEMFRWNIFSNNVLMQIPSFRIVTMIAEAGASACIYRASPPGTAMPDE